MWFLSERRDINQYNKQIKERTGKKYIFVTDCVFGMYYGLRMKQGM